MPKAMQREIETLAKDFAVKISSGARALGAYLPRGKIDPLLLGAFAVLMAWLLVAFVARMPRPPTALIGLVGIGYFGCVIRTEVARRALIRRRLEARRAIILRRIEDASRSTMALAA